MNINRCERISWTTQEHVSKQEQPAEQRDFLHTCVKLYPLVT